MRSFIYPVFLVACVFSSFQSLAYGTNPPDPYQQLIQAESLDTFPAGDRQGDFITDDVYNPFDIQPSVIKQEVEYDPESGYYIVTEKIGDEFYRAPTYMTFNEYIEYRNKKQQREQFGRMSGVDAPRARFGEVLNPIERIDLGSSLVDRLFGGTDVTIEPKGNIDLTFGVDYQRIQNPFIPPRLQSQGGFDFDMDIQMNVEGNIGEKMNLDFNYDTNASFDFDNKIKIDYDSEQFSEDDIIKKIEAGDVSLPLRSNLIQGPQKLFGVKTVAQFGRLTLTGVASQQRSERKDLQIENGALVQEFEIRPDEYDENRHFFIAHYFRDIYESALSNMPQVRSLVQIQNIEVWVTNEQNSNLRSSSKVAAISYLGESDLSEFSDPDTEYPPNNTFMGDERDVDQRILPENGNSRLFAELVQDENTRVNAASELQSKYGLSQVRDFEIQSMRRLNANEFTFHPQLGYISLNTRLRPNQVLGVAFEYTYSLNGNEVYKVGEITNETGSGGTTFDPTTMEEEASPDEVIYVKMLKSSNQRVDLPSWDLMMKNVYSLGTSQLTQEDFLLDIFYEDNEDVSLKRFLPEDGFRQIPLLDFFQLDRLNSYGDPQQDGIFDFQPGLTVNTRTGSIFFPVLEPFGNSLLKLLDGNEILYEKYGFPTLYDNSVTLARENLDKNLFVIKGTLKSSVSSEINLGSFNIPQGSVTVRAGSQILREGIDYDIDYGIGRIKILNDAYLQQGVPIRVSFEDQSLFSLQQKTMFGLRADFAVNKKLNIGGTYMRLFERPFTQKVNIGSDPINNRVFGLDLNYSSEAPFVTRLVDKLPFINTKEPSLINFSAEVAALKPGHSGAINIEGEDEGVVSLDDFEGASSSIPLGSRPNLWYLASTPSRFAESSRTDDRSYGYNRALLNWYIIDDRTIRSQADGADPYTRIVQQRELFNRDVPRSQISDLLTFDLAYYPSERGQYNFDPPAGSEVSAGLELDDSQQKVVLKDPESRWGGIMRYLPNNDFQAANFEYIEFWMLNPFIEDRDGNEQPIGEDGSLFFNLGNVSEDILKDNQQFYENSVKTPGENTPELTTAWGLIPLTIPQVNAFDLEFRREQDLGLDGLDDDGERAMFSDYVSEVAAVYPEDFSVETDPSNDNFISYRDERFNGAPNLQERYLRYNHPQGNAPEETSRIGTGNPIPDAEDLNDNRSLEQSEAYYEYEVKLRNENGEIDVVNAEFVTDVRDVLNPSGETEKWYRFQIPIQDESKAVNGIQGFRSIQFMRMYMTGFETPKLLRLAEFELVRNQWRRLPRDCSDVNNPDELDASSFVVNEIGIEENSSKLPFNYVSPKGIVQERVFNTFANVLQDENALNLNICELPDSCDARMYKLTQLDMRYYKRLQMFAHAEIDPSMSGEFENGELSAYIRLGKDFNNNYYEYEIPLFFSDTTLVDTDNPISNIPDDDYSAIVWREENDFDLNLELLRELKKRRNLEQANITDVFSIGVSELAQTIPGDTTSVNGIVRIKGNPSLGYVKGITIGVRHNNRGSTFCGEVWVNELRINGLDENGGIAGEARLEIQLADLGDFTASAAYSSVGWGSLEERTFERSLESITEYDVATNLNLGKFLPNDWGVQIPFYAQYAKSKIQDQFDPFELDLKVDELIESTTDPELIEDIKDRSAQTTTIKTVNFTNVRKERTAGAEKKPMPWDISNFTVSYGHTRTEYKDDIILQDIADDQRGSLTYNYTRSGKPIQPFKKIKSKHLKILKEFNFNPFPNSFSFSTELRRFKSVKEYRIPRDIDYVFNDQRFDWDRRYTLDWDFTKALKMNFTATNFSVVDEIRPGSIRIDRDARPFFNKFGREVEEVNVLADIALKQQAARDTLTKNLRDFGRNKNYDHQLNLSYTLPIRYLPYMDWVTVKAGYDADYAWTVGSLSVNNGIPLGSSPDGVDGIQLGNIISNNQSRSLTATFAFDKLYDKSKYIKSLDRSNSSRRSSRNRGQEKKEPTAGGDDQEKQKRDGPSAIAKLLVRPLFSLRNFKFSYKERLSTVIPGFLPESNLLGLSSGFDAPGWGFVLGLQPDLASGQYLDDAARKGWITPDRFQNQQVLQNTQQTYQADIEIEPWKDFKLDVNFKKSFTSNHSEYFINSNPDTAYATPPLFQHTTLRDVGSFDVTYFSMQTLFNSDVNGLFDIFQRNRAVVSNRLAELERNGNENPNLGEIHDEDGPAYAKGFGRQQNDVLIHSFLAAYTGKDLTIPNALVEDDISLNITKEIQSRGYLPAPNWTLRWDGLAKMEAFRNIFSSFRVTHGYKSTLKVSRFETDLQYQSALEDPLQGAFFINPELSSQNYYAIFEIPAVVIAEAFDPIIGIDIKTTNDITAGFEYKKTRNLSLLTGNISQLTEARNTEMSFNFGWVLQDVSIFGGNNKRKRQARGADNDEGEQTRGNQRVTNSRGRQMSISFDFSFRDDVTWIHEIDKGASAEPIRGLKTLRLNPSVEYDLNENLSLRAFVDFSRTQPYLSTSYPITSVQGGVTARFNLN